MAEYLTENPIEQVSLVPENFSRPPQCLLAYNHYCHVHLKSVQPLVLQVRMKEKPSWGGWCDEECARDWALALCFAKSCVPEVPSNGWHVSHCGEWNDHPLYMMTPSDSTQVISSVMRRPLDNLK